MPSICLFRHICYFTWRSKTGTEREVFPFRFVWCSSRSWVGVVGFRKEVPEVKCPSHPIISQQGSLSLKWPSLLTLVLIPWPRSCLSDFTVKSPSPSSLLGSLEGRPPPEEWGGGYTPAEGSFVFFLNTCNKTLFCMALGCQFAVFKHCPDLSRCGVSCWNQSGCVFGVDFSAVFLFLGMQWNAWIRRGSRWNKEKH